MPRAATLVRIASTIRLALSPDSSATGAGRSEVAASTIRDSSRALRQLGSAVTALNAPEAPDGAPGHEDRGQTRLARRLRPASSAASTPCPAAACTGTPPPCRTSRPAPSMRSFSLPASASPNPRPDDHQLAAEADALPGLLLRRLGQGGRRVAERLERARCRSLWSFLSSISALVGALPLARRA